MKRSPKSTADLPGPSVPGNGGSQSLAVTLTAAALLALSLVLFALFSSAEQPLMPPPSAIHSSQHVEVE
jgi:hypothetical protein